MNTNLCLGFSPPQRLTFCLHRDYDPADDLEYSMLSDLTLNHQELKRIAIPETDTNWAWFLADSKNLSQIVVYKAKAKHIYERFEKIEEASAAGIQFKISLVDLPQEPSEDKIFPSAAEARLRALHSYMRALIAKIYVHIVERDGEWKLHSVGPMTKRMLVDLQEVEQ
jgi:hypothetical protein